MPRNPLKILETQRFCHNEPRFKVVYSRDNLSNKIKNGGICKKSWWMCWYWHSLDCFELKW